MFTVDRFVRYSASQSMCLSSLDLVHFLCISNECRDRDDAVYLRKSHMWCICMKQKTHNVLKISAHSKSRRAGSFFPFIIVFSFLNLFYVFPIKKPLPVAGYFFFFVPKEPQRESK